MDEDKNWWWRWGGLEEIPARNLKNAAVSSSSFLFVPLVQSKSFPEYCSNIQDLEDPLTSKWTVNISRSHCSQNIGGAPCAWPKVCTSSSPGSWKCGRAKWWRLSIIDRFQLYNYCGHSSENDTSLNFQVHLTNETVIRLYCMTLQLSKMQLLPISRMSRSFSNFRKSKSVTSPLSSPISVFRSIIFQQHVACFACFHVPSGCTWKWAAGLQALHALRAHESFSKSNVFPWVIHLDSKPTGMLNPNSNIGTVRRMPHALSCFVSISDDDWGREQNPAPLEEPHHRCSAWPLSHHSAHPQKPAQQSLHRRLDISFWMDSIRYQYGIAWTSTVNHYQYRLSML